MEKAVVAWSGGKESALALYDVREHSSIEPAELLVRVSGRTGRVSQHGVRPDLVARQADALGPGLTRLPIPTGVTGEEYVDLMAERLASLAAEGITRFVVGDLFLEENDDRGDGADDASGGDTFRERAIDRAGVGAFYPLQGEDTADLAQRVIETGIEARTVCVDADALGREFLGRTVDEAFLADLPDGVDSCGEGGEYHTFVQDGPGFDGRVGVRLGRVEERTVHGTRMLYQELLPPEAGGEP